MPLDGLPGSLVVPARDESRESYLRSMRVRNPAASTLPNTQPYIDASALADMLQPVYRDAVVINNGVTLKNATGSRLDDRGAAFGELGARLGAIGASGYVAVSASSGGTNIFVGDIIKSQSGIKYKCNATALYHDGDPCPIIGSDTGPLTNQTPGTVLTWETPRPGCGSTATVNEQGDGTGLTGGHDSEDDDTYRQRLIDLQSNPPASGNDAEYQAVCFRTPGVAVQQAFTYPAINGPGSMGVIFTLRPSAPGQSRIPNGTQIAAVLAWLQSNFPADDGIFVGTLTAQNTNVTLKVTWASGAPTWVDTAPWPAYYAAAGPGQAIVVSAATDATHFTLSTNNGNYSGVTAPVAGQTIAAYDASNQLFRRKKILTVTGTGPWVIVCDTTNGASDTSYKPVVNRRVCPWSDSLNNVPAAVIGHFDGLGPGEQVNTFFDPGQRQRRSPVSPLYYPNQVTNRLIEPVLALPSVGDAVLLEPTVPAATPVGTPGVLSYLLVLADIAVFPE